MDEGDEPPRRRKKWSSRVGTPRKQGRRPPKNESVTPPTVEPHAGLTDSSACPLTTSSGGEPSQKRPYVKGRLSMPDKRHKMDTSTLQVSTGPSSTRDEALDQPCTSTAIQVGFSSQDETAHRPCTTAANQPGPSSITSPVEASQPQKQPLEVSDNIYKEVIWTMPVDTNVSLDKSVVKETADEEDLVYNDDASLSTQKLETIVEDPYEGLDNDGTNKNIIEENDEIKITVASFVAFSLQALVSSCWCIDSNENTVRLSCLSPFENVSVQKSIVWNGEEIKIFVHNRPLPSDNFMWNSTKLLDRENIGEVIDVLLRLSQLCEYVKVCEGVKLYENQWKMSEEQGRGTCEKGIYEDFKCFRDTNCSLFTIERSRCGNCHRTQRNMKDQVRRSKDLSKDQTRTNDRYKSSEEKDEKLAQLEREKKILQGKLNRIRKRVKRLIASNTVRISDDSAKDLGRLFEQEYSFMSEVERIFWTEQLKALSLQRKNRSSMRWNPFVIKLALHLRMKTTSQGYKYIKHFIRLPSERTLYDYSHAVQAKEGIQDAAIEDLVQKSTEYQEDHLKFFNLEFDEMHIRQDLVINRKTGDLVGYANLRQVEKDLADIEAEISSTSSSPAVAKTVLVYLAQGVTNPLLNVVGIYPSRDLSAAQLFSRTWEVIYTMESSGLKVLCLICDGASTNKKFFRMHPALDPLEVGSEYTYATKNLAAPEDRPLFFMIDPPHLLKTLRNCLANSYSHKKSRKMWKNHEDLSWETLDKLHKISANVKEKDKGDKYTFHKLTLEHIKLTPFSCMKVLLATQTMSNSVAVDLNDKKNHSSLANCDTSELIKFLKIVNDGFDCFNGSGDIHGKRNKINNLLTPYTQENDQRFEWLQTEYLGFFKEWKNDIEKKKGNVSATMREKMFISQQAYESLHITTYGFIGSVKFMLREANAPSIDAKGFNQDKLEQYFGNLRMSQGGGRNPNAQEVQNRSNLLRVQDNAAKPVTSGNTTVDQEEWIPDQRPMKKIITKRK